MTDVNLLGLLELLAVQKCAEIGRDTLDKIIPSGQTQMAVIRIQQSLFIVSPTNLTIVITKII